MQHLRHPFTAALALLAGLGAAAPAGAAEHIVDIAWDAGGRFAHRASVAPGRFVELCGKVERGRAVRWRFESAQALDFNIHYHVGEQVHYPARQAQVSRGSDVLRATLTQDYCWMWRNKSERAAAIEVELQR